MIRPNKTNIKPVDAVPYSDCPAKTYVLGNGQVTVGRSVFNHCQIVGEVAREIIRRMPTHNLRLLFPEGSALAAGGHDNGKVSPTFYNKIMKACGLPLLPGFRPELERDWGGHAGVSQLMAVALSAPEYVPEILGQHHGFSPMLAGLRAKNDCFGGDAWFEERKKLLDALQSSLGETWPEVSSVAQARVLAGLTSVADWIGSGEFFEDPNEPWQDNIGKALDKAGFVAPEYQQKLSFDDVFGFSPRQAQSLLIEQIESPGVYVLEAPMGLGKTEAALYAAYKMLVSGQASGIYFALPTQLTSNKIFERFQQFLRRVLAGGCTHKSLLLHANAWLFDTDMGEEGQPGGAWFSQAKRGLLAPFAVGTIDQALMAAMNVKHGFVRAFGLAGKVVILDEVHTYDAYTGTILDALVSLLRELQCTVIILSATLNQQRRQQLLASKITKKDYPLITASPGNTTSSPIEVAVPITESREIHIKVQLDDVLAVEQALRRAEQGQQVLWIENTVKEAQQRYLDLAARAAELGIDCGLLHSRFTVNDRQSVEARWVNLYGKNGWQQRQLQGRILVGTQVLEQSLDIDADFLVSRFAPTDMLLQRLGRLWRHSGTPRAASATPEAWLLAPEIDAAIAVPTSAFGSTAYVYSPYVLCRSLEVWQSIIGLNLPSDIRNLIEATYAEREELGAMRRWLDELDNGTRRNKGRLALRQLANMTLSQAGKTLPESKAQTRYSETDNFEVLLLQSLSRDAAGEIATLTLLSGDSVLLPIRNRKKLDRNEWRARTSQLMQQVVMVRPADAPKVLSRDILQRFGLHHCFYLGNPDWPDDESLLRVALVDESGFLKGIEHMDIHDKHMLEYRDDIGYRVIND